MTLAAVSEAAERKASAEAAYRSAVLAAANDHGLSETARAAGVTRQAVAQLVKRARTDESATRARLDELDKRWQKLVTHRAKSYTLKSAKAHTAGYNAEAKKRAKRGLPRHTTVREQAFALAEAELLDLVYQGVDDEGFDLEVVRAEIDEADALRARLAPTEEIPF